MKKKGLLNSIAAYWKITKFDVGRELLVIPADKRLAEQALQIKIDKEIAFYTIRFNALQKFQKEFREPERTIICNILANGRPKP